MLPIRNSRCRARRAMPSHNGTSRMTAQSVFIIAAFLAVFWRIYRMSAATDRLAASVQANTAATEAAVAKITALPGSDDAAVNAASDQIDANTAALTGATPSA